MKRINLIMIIICFIFLNVKIDYSYYFYDNNANWTGDYHEYNDDIEVITAVEVYAPEGFPRQNRRPHERKDDDAKNKCIGKSGECKVNFNISGASGSSSMQGAIAKGESRLFWVKWKTPKVNDLNSEKTVTINVTLSSGGYIVMNGSRKTSATITCKIYKPKYEVPPDTDFDDYKDEGDIESYAPVGRMPDVLEKPFHTYTYRWVPDWHYVCTRSGSDEEGYPEDGSYPGWNSEMTCQEHKCPENAENHECPHGDCHIDQQDWGEVVWEKHEHSIRLQITSQKLQLADNTPFIDGYPQEFDYDRIETIRSGYGAWYRVNCTSIFVFAPNREAIQYDDDKYFTYPQVIMYFYPEFDYDNYADRGDNTIGTDMGTQFKTMENDVPKNPYSHFNNHVHYIPVYFPDGAYEILAEVSSCFSPAGELTLSTSNYCEILGSVWDDLHIKQDN